MARGVNGEIELKLEVGPDRARQLKRQPLLAAAERRSKTQLSVYYDTPKRALRNHGFTLRVRSASGGFVQTVKPATESAGLFARDEWECEVGSIEPEVDKLAGLPLEHLWRAGKLDKLVPVVRSRVQRTSWRLTEGASAIQVDFDEGTIAGGDGDQALCELELELIEGEPADLVRVARQLAARVPVRIGVLSKAERGFALADGTLGQVHKAGPVAVDDGMTIGEAFTIVVNACLKHYRMNEPLVIATQAAPTLHQARVAMRRLRSAFTLFRPAITDGDYSRLREELRWFTAQLGDARNLDVYLERALAEDERQALIERRADAYRQVIEAMRSQRQRDLMLDLVGWIAVGEWRRNKRALRAIKPYAVKRLDKLWFTVEGPAAGIAAMDEESRHRLRIQIKKLRYAVEFLRGLFLDESKQLKRFGAAVAGLQEALGKLNDLATARTLAAAGVAAATADGDESEHLAEAGHCARRLAKAGPFWRSEEGWLVGGVARQRVEAARPTDAAEATLETT